jgi:uncharacterized membrane protein YgcG
MYKCICGFKSVSRATMDSHMQNCTSVRRKVEERGYSTDEATSFIASSFAFDLCCSAISDYSTSSYSPSYSGGGGSFDGGGSSSSYDSCSSSSSCDSSSSSCGCD